MRQKCYLTLATGRVWLISYQLRISHMGSDVGKIFRQRANIGITRSRMCWYVRIEDLSRGSLFGIKRLAE